VEYKLFDAPEVKMSGDGSGFLTGYASSHQNFDSVRERVVKGAFAAGLADFMRDGFIAVGHNWSALPIATPVEAKEDDFGLKVVGEFHSTKEAQDARTVIKERLDRGKSVKLSIGYEVLDDERTDEGRLLKALKLYEWSYVTVPANHLAAVTSAKSWPASGLPFTEHSERVVSAVQEFLHRAEERTEARFKDGRILSAANERDIEQVVSILQSLIERSRSSRARGASEAEMEDQSKELERIYAQFQTITERYGVTP
jgi:HK97 family phage prohead protease